MPRPRWKTCAIVVAVAGLLGSSVALAGASPVKVTVDPGKVVDDSVTLRLEDAHVLRKNSKFTATLFPDSVAELQLHELSQAAYVTCSADAVAASSLTIEEYVHSGSKYLLIETETFAAFPDPIAFLVDPDPSGDYAYRISANNTWALHSCTVEML